MLSYRFSYLDICEYVCVCVSMLVCVCVSLLVRHCIFLVALDYGRHLYFLLYTKPLRSRRMRCKLIFFFCVVEQV